MSAIGIMDGAFFVGRKEIVDWINNTLDLNINKVEDTASGAVACELFDIIYPGSVNMSKVNWAATQSFEYVANYKILQTAFQKNAVDKYIDVDRLITGRYMDNLEFMQWFKRYFELQNASKDDYDTIGQRAKGKGGAAFFPRSGASSNQAAVRKPSNAPRVESKKVPSETAKPQSKLAKPTPAAKPAPAPTRTVRAPSKVEDSAAEKTIESLQAEIESLKAHAGEYEKTIADLKDDVEATEKERDFYFEKLRDIEILLQGREGAEDAWVKDIFKILYATAEGFEVVAGEATDSEEVNEESY